MQDYHSCLICHMEQRLPVYEFYELYRMSSVFRELKKSFRPSFCFDQCQVTHRFFMTVSNLNRFIHMKTVMLA